MKTSALLPFKAPEVEKPACAACKTFAPECLVPMGEGSKAMCWLCAHHVVEHGTAMEHAYCAECECDPSEIYPKHVLEARLEYCAHMLQAAPGSCARCEGT